MTTVIKFIKDFFNANIQLILMLMLISLFTLALLEYRNQASVGVRQEGESKEGVLLSSMEKISVPSWRDYYGGSMGVDKVILFEGPSVRISTGVDGGWYGALGEVEMIDLTDSSIRFAVRFEDVKSLDTFLILMGAGEGDGFDDYFSFNVKGYFANPTGNTWHEIVVDKSDFDIAEGNPDWSKINKVGIRVSAAESEYQRIWFGGLSRVDNVAPEPIISFTFDDGFASTVDAAMIMNKYDYKGTLYVIPEYLGNQNYLLQEDVDYLHSLGWDISGHGASNLRLLSGAEIDGELAISRNYLNSKRYKGREHYAYPNGGYDESIRSLVAEYYETARTIDGLSQPQGYIIPTKVNAKTISVSYPVSDIKGWIDDAIDEDSWLILVWHDIVDVPKNDTQYDIGLFEEVVDYVNSKNVTVLPYSEAYDKLMRY